MPNWCFTEYVVTGEKSEIKDLHKKMKSLEKRKKSLVENGFGKTWMGNLVELFGGDWKKTYCRGSWDIAELTPDGNLYFTAESAWEELSEWRRFIESQYKTITFYFMSEEPGMQIYQTNDSNRDFFTRRYAIELEDNGREEFDTYDEARTYVEQTIGRELKDDEDLEESLYEWAKATKGDDFYVSFIEYELVD